MTLNSVIFRQSPLYIQKQVDSNNENKAHFSASTPSSKQISFQSDNSEVFQRPNPKQKLCQDSTSPDAESIIFPLQNDTKHSSTFQVGQDSTNKARFSNFLDTPSTENLQTTSSKVDSNYSNQKPQELTIFDLRLHLIKV